MPPRWKQYARPERLPFFLIESAYENEHEATERRLPNHWPAPVTWQEALRSRGAQSMTRLRNLLTSISWWLLEPDTSNALLTEGLGVEGDRAVAARSADRSFALLYLPSRRGITVDLGKLAGPRVAARWYDPANGRFTTVSGSPFRASGPRRFGRDLGANSSGFRDWVLLLESQS